MKAIVQRVKEARVEVNGKPKGSIGKGLLVFLGVGRDDTEEDSEWMAEKIVNLRIFEKEEGRLDYSLLDVDGELLVVSQFTLYGDCSKGRRPSFTEAMDKEKAEELFNDFVERVKRRVKKVETGVFRAHMDVYLVNEGPVTLIVDSKRSKS
ncbi:MAG: D-aminoacyl-tRNA deacylase [Desulfobacterota bacterium]|nr:D-aminoacyl-tRNA deacylase [Thermodesulfobacteriota bacterium]MDW8002292.1 D-aminoacyl-tRNA deacylase [Deltaproteobacteria bacterium]